MSTGPLGVDPIEKLYRALGRALALEPRCHGVVITGDLVDRGEPGEYAALKDLIESYPLPIYLMPGNHDDVSGFLKVFGGTRFTNGSQRPYYTVGVGAAELIVLDSAVAGSPAGRVGSDQLRFLALALDSLRDVPVFVALHHPPFAVGIPFLDEMGLANGVQFSEIIRLHPQVVRVLAGHIHRVTTHTDGATVVVTAGSTHRTSRLAADGSIPHYVDEPTSLLLHRGDGSSWTTHVVPIDGGPIAPFRISATGISAEAGSGVGSPPDRP